MKKSLLALAAVALLFATSCKKESVNPAVDVPEGSFLATIDNGANPQNAPRINDGMGTMTTIDGSNYVIWENGDEISINGSTYTTSSTPGNTVVFSGGNATGSTFHAFYPASIAGTDNAGTLPATQTIEFDNQGNAKVNNLPMYAYSTNNQLTFHNICAALKITVSVACNSIVVSADENICGEFTVDNTTHTAQLAGTGEHLGKSLTVSRSTGSFTANEIIYVAVPANTYHNFTIQCKDAQNQVVFAKVIESTTVAVNKVYNLTLSSQPTIPANCFCFTATANNVIVDMTAVGSAPTVNLQYCRYVTATGAYSNWNTYTVGSDITLANGDKVYFRAGSGGNTNFATSTTNYNKFTSTGNVTVSGDIMYLLSQTPATALTNEYAFACLFYNMINLTDASGLILPNTLSNYCYNSMFQGCSALTAAPILSAETRLKGCYCSMFKSCSKLSAVTMLANNVSEGNYMQAFNYWLDDAGTDVTTPTLYVTDEATKQIMEYERDDNEYIPSNWSVVVYTTPSQIRRK